MVQDWSIPCRCPEHCWKLLRRGWKHQVKPLGKTGRWRGGVGRALQTDGGRGQEGSEGGGTKEDQTGKDMRQTPAAGVTNYTCETWLKEPKMRKENKWKTKMKAGGGGLGCSSPTNKYPDGWVCTQMPWPPGSLTQPLGALRLTPPQALKRTLTAISSWGLAPETSPHPCLYVYMSIFSCPQENCIQKSNSAAGSDRPVPYHVQQEQKVAFKILQWLVWQ